MRPADANPIARTEDPSYLFGIRVPSAASACRYREPRVSLSNSTLGARLNDQEQRGPCRQILLIANCGPGDAWSTKCVKCRQHSGSALTSNVVSSPDLWCQFSSAALYQVNRAHSAPPNTLVSEAESSHIVGSKRPSTSLSPLDRIEHERAKSELKALVPVDAERRLDTAYAPSTPSPAPSALSCCRWNRWG
jgi:hypothetical protein